MIQTTPDFNPQTRKLELSVLELAKQMKKNNISPSFMLQLMNQLGAAQMAMSIVQKPTEIFKKLWEKRLLDLSMEAFILRNPNSFDKGIQKVCEERLTAFGYTK